MAQTAPYPILRVHQPTLYGSLRRQLTYYMDAVKDRQRFPSAGGERIAPLLSGRVRHRLWVLCVLASLRLRHCSVHLWRRAFVACVLVGHVWFRVYEMNNENVTETRRWI